MNKFRASAIALTFLCLLFPLLSHASELVGKVVGVTDGDTIVVLDAAKTRHRVRLAGIDAPEHTQDYGVVAKTKLSNLCFGQQVRIEVSDTDKYGREIGRVFVGDMDCNLTMVQSGLAWWYQQYAPDNKALQKAEADSKALKAGLWNMPNAVPPWEYRRTKKDKKEESAATQQPATNEPAPEFMTEEEQTRQLVEQQIDAETAQSKADAARNQQAFIGQQKDHQALDDAEQKARIASIRVKAAAQRQYYIDNPRAQPETGNYRTHAGFTPSYPSYYQYTPPPMNTSYYGQISGNTGRPKTVHVNSYRRRDGTVVQEHYRSAPRR